MAYIDVDIEHYLYKVSDIALRQELKRRAKGISAADARVTLDEAAFRLRKIDRFDLAFKLDEIRHDYF